jgi:hypothetical protein
MFLFLLKPEQWRQRKHFVELARLVILLGLFWACTICRLVVNFCFFQGGGRGNHLLGPWGVGVVCLAFAVCCFSGGRKIVVVGFVALICLFCVGLARFFAVSQFIGLSMHRNPTVIISSRTCRIPHRRRALRAA